MAKKRGLGKGLNALLGGANTQQNKDADKSGTVAATPPWTSKSASSSRSTGKGVSGITSKVALSANDVSASETTDRQATQPVNPDISDLNSGEKLRSLPIERIRRGSYQPRVQFDRDALEELGESIKEQGMIQPILVRPFADGFEIIAGERRWRAAQMAGLQQVPAIVRDLDDRSVAAVSLIENIQRKDLNPLEEARALQRLQSEFGMTHQEVATSIGRSRAAVTNLMRLLDLHEEVKVLINKGELDMGHARALLALDTSQQLKIARMVVDKGLSVRAVEKMVKSFKNPSPSVKPTQRDPDIVSLEKSLGHTLAAPVSIKHHGSGKGKLEINYNSLDELEGILSHIK